MNHLVLIDGYGFVFRAFHSLPPLSRKDGLVVGAVFGFTQMLMKLISDTHCSHIAVVFDSGGKNFRHELYPSYKAHRPDVPEDLIKQFPLVRQAAQAFNIPSLELHGYEADDIIATLAKNAEKEDFKVTIVSSDKDLMQLVTKNVIMFDPLKYRIISEKEVKEKFGVEPIKVRDVLALIGDASDNIPGVKGIGPKGAEDLIGRFGSLNELLLNTDKITAKKQKENLLNNIENAKLSYELVRLDENVPIISKIDDLIIKKVDLENLRNFLERNEFRKLISRAEDLFKSNDNGNYKRIKNGNFEDIDLRMDNLDKFCELANHSNILVIYPVDEETLLLGLKSGEYITTTFPLKSSVNNLLLDSSINKISFGIKNLLKNYIINSFDDLQIMSYVVDSSFIPDNLSLIIQKHLMEDAPQLTDNIKVKYLFKLFEVLNSKLLEIKSLNLYHKVEKPVINLLAKMEKLGIKLSKEKILEAKQEFASELQNLENQIFAECNAAFNIGSPKQLGEILFDKMQLPGAKKTKSGNYSTDNEVLEALSWQGYEIAKKVIEWRQFSKLTSTYTDPLLNLVEEDGRLHTTYSQVTTITGRLSSSKPNLQNIPIKTKEGQKIRKAFIAEANNSLISLDYSQIELRLIAHIADIKELKEAFKHNEDIHNITASQVFGVPLNEVTEDLRRKAKTVNYSIIYGITPFGLAQRLMIAKNEAKEIIDKYLLAYNGIKEYIDHVHNFARSTGYVTTLMGRRCYINDINSNNGMIRSFAERLTINAPIQGSAADIIKLAMTEADNFLSNYKTKLLLQVHDELIFESPPEEAEKIAISLKNIMENVVKLSIPLEANLSIGKNWGEL